MRFLFNNFWLKVLALAIGLLIWFHVATDKTYTYQLRLPVTHVEVREHFTLATLPPDSLTVVLSAKGKQLIRTEWREQGIKINASKLGIGQTMLTLTPDNTTLVNTSKNLRIDEVLFPNPIELNIDVESKVEVPVTPLLTVTADDGFAVTGQIEVQPSKIVLTGPKSVVRNIKSIHTESREFSSLRNSITVSARLVPPTGFDVRLDPDSVRLGITVVPVRTRVYERLPVIVYSAPVGRSVNTNPSSIRVELSGPPDEIDLLNANALTVSVDFRKRDPQTGMAPIKIDCPANFHVKKTSHDAVRIIGTPDAHPGN
jgi:hypothetical protein